MGQGTTEITKNKWQILHFISREAMVISMWRKNKIECKVVQEDSSVWCCNV